MPKSIKVGDLVILKGFPAEDIPEELVEVTEVYADGTFGYSGVDPRGFGLQGESDPGQVKRQASAWEAQFLRGKQGDLVRKARSEVENARFLLS